MEELRNLKQIYSLAAGRFNQYEGKDFILPKIFKEQVTEINSNTITYNDYSAVIETRGNQNGVLNIYLPNQWFYIASYFTDFYNELQRYKKEALQVVSKERLKDLNGSSLTEQEELRLQRLSLSEQSKSYLRRFMTDYSWWYGAKTIDRGDFYVSPILNSARLVNASQSFVADLCAFLANKTDLVQAIISGEEAASKKNNTSNPFSYQQIYYGAPGTGKSHEINRLTEGEEVIRTTFHPDSDYSTFVGCYKPHMEEVDMTTVIGKELIVVKDESGQPKKERRIVYKYSCQAFLQAYIAAWQHPDRAQYLVIEEINRGNCAQIFGDIFQLLDRNDEGYSSYPIKTDADAENELRALFSKEWNLAEEKAKEIDDLYRKHYPDGITKSIKDGSILLLPSNLYIWATMNTSDQSLFPIDSAFKRRWDWKYVKIAEGRDSETKELLNWVVRFDYEEDNKPYTFECSWWQFILAINEKIANATSSDDKKLGYFFCKPKTQESKEIDAERFVGKVVFYLWNDVFKDEDNAIFKVVEGKGDPSFDTFYTEDDNGMTIADTKALRVFMHNVFGEQSELYTEKAKNSTDTEEMDSDEEIEDDDNNDVLRSVAHRQLISVTFPDGTKYDISDGLTHFAVYKEAIRKIGVERAATIASNSKYHRKNHPVISKERFSDVEGDRYSYEQIGDYYLIKGMSNDTYINILNLCDSQLNLGLDIQFKQ